MKKYVIMLAKKFGKTIGQSYSEKSRKQVDTWLEKAHMKINAEEYYSFLTIISVMFTAYAIIITWIFIQDITWTGIVSLIIFLVFYVGLKFYPQFEAKKRGKTIEAELPTVLRTIGIQLDIKIQFEKIIDNLAKEDYEISYEFKIAQREIKSGRPIPIALQNITERVESETLNRVINQLIMNYEKGGEGEQIKRIANQLMEIQSSELKAFEAKTAFTGLIFIAVSCLMPAFFQIFISISSLLGTIALTPLHVWIIFVFVFPVISLMSLIFINLSTPPIANLHKSSFKKDMIIIQRFMKDKKWLKINDENDPEPVKQLFIKIIVAGVLLAIISLIMGITIHAAGYMLSFIFIMSPFIVYFYLLFLAENRILKIEKSLPDALTHAAMLQKGMSTEKIIQEIGKTKGPLGNEFQIAYRQIVAGSDIDDALNAIAERNNSILIKRATKLIVHGYYAGADMYVALRETAEDIYSLFNLISQRKAVLSLQKYTLILGGAVLVPLILGSIIQVVDSLSSEGLISLIVEHSEDTFALMDSVKMATQVYLIIFSIISGIMIAQQEGEPKKAIIYITLIVLSGIILYNLALNYGVV